MKRAFKYDAAISATEFDALGVGELSRRLQHRIGKTVYATPQNGDKPQTAATLAAAILSDTVEGRLLRRPPHIPLEAARMSTTLMAFDDSRARSELGYAPRPARAALTDSVRWFVDAGYVTHGRRLAAIRHSDVY